MTNDELIAKISNEITRFCNWSGLVQWIVDIIPVEDGFFYIFMESRGFSPEKGECWFCVFLEKTLVFEHSEYKECLRFVKNQFPNKTIPRAKVRFSHDRILGQ